MDALERAVYEAGVTTTDTRQSITAEHVEPLYALAMEAAHGRERALEEAAEKVVPDEGITFEWKGKSLHISKAHLVTAFLREIGQDIRAAEYAGDHDAYGHRITGKPRQDWFGKDYSHE